MYFGHDGGLKIKIFKSIFVLGFTSCIACLPEIFFGVLLDDENK